MLVYDNIINRLRFLIENTKESPINILKELIIKGEVDVYFSKMIPSDIYKQSILTTEQADFWVKVSKGVLNHSVDLSKLREKINNK